MPGPRLSVQGHRLPGRTQSRHRGSPGKTQIFIFSFYPVINQGLYSITLVIVFASEKVGFREVLTYILVGAGAAIAVIALAVVLLDDGEQQTVARRPRPVSPPRGRRTTAQDKARADDRRQMNRRKRPGFLGGASAGEGASGNPSTRLSAPPTPVPRWRLTWHRCDRTERRFRRQGRPVPK